LQTVKKRSRYNFVQYILDSESRKKKSEVAFVLHTSYIPFLHFHMLQSFPTLSCASSYSEVIAKHLILRKCFILPLTISSCSAVHLTRLKSRGLASGWRKNNLSFFFFFCLFTVGERDNKKRLRLRKEKKIIFFFNIKELNACFLVIKEKHIFAKKLKTKLVLKGRNWWSLEKKFCEFHLLWIFFIHQSVILVTKIYFYK
jgi:hypothetical protein